VVYRCDSWPPGRTVEEVMSDVQFFQGQGGSGDGSYSDDITVVVLQNTLVPDSGPGNV
jgi:hypothetical protein